MVYAAEAIVSIPLFSDVNDKTIDFICQNARLVRFKKDAVIYDSASYHEKCFFYIIHGWVKLCRISFDGEEIILDILTDTHHFNENLLFEKTTDPFSAQAIDNLQTMIIPIRLLKDLIRQDHQLSINFLQGSIQRQRHLIQDIEYLSMRRASHRIASFLLSLSAQRKTKTLRLPYHKSLLATRLGMRPETFSRALAKLCRDCHIDVRRGTLYIHNADKLETYSGNSKAEQKEHPVVPLTSIS